MDDVQIGTVRKNGREQFRVAIREFRGVRMVDLRVYAENGKGEVVPTPKGVAIKPDLLGEIIDRLGEARDRARSLGMLLEEQPARHWQDGG